MATLNKGIGNEVCVVGTGVLGLLAIKNLLEQDLQVTAFERNEYLGGTWHASQNPEQVSALPLTTANTSRHSCAFTDFPMPREYPTHPPQKDIEKYLESYARHFELLPHIQFSTVVDHIERDEADGKWRVYIRDSKSGAEEQRIFDRVVVATGILNTKNQPTVKGVEKFAGDVIHSRQFKDPSKYEGKNVLVVGIGATGADTTSFLNKVGAGKIYLSHRSQYFLLPRLMNGKAFDHTMTRRVGTIVRAIGSFWPRGCAALMSKGLTSMRTKAFPWLNDHPSFLAPRSPDSVLHRIPFFSDDLAQNLRDGRIQAVTGIQEITGPKSVTLTDGSILDDIDTIIFCSGYHYDFSMVRGAGDPTDAALAPDKHERIRAARYNNPEDNFPRLYRGFISEQYPESLAILGHFIIMKPPFVLYDLVTMAIASIWTGDYAVPLAEEMRKDIDTHYDFIVSTLNRGPVPHLGFRIASSDTYDWLNRAAGTGVTDRLACFRWEAWKLWWNDRKFYNLLMDGLDVPAVYRLFDTGRGRKPWAGARENIESTNAEVKAMGEAWQKENADKKTK
ncbi:Fc.00g050640.m01.CDS01 [Cosmosporella sp. VM-42]